MSDVKSKEIHVNMYRAMRNQVILFLGALISLSSCMTGSQLPDLDPFRTEKITFVAEPDANRGQATRVEVIFALDAETLKKIEGFTALGWASVQDTQVGDWEDKVLRVERMIKPGEHVTIDSFPDGWEKAVGYVIFAHYSAPGLHRRVFVGESSPTLYLHGDRISSSAGKPFELTRPPEPATAQRGG